MVELPPTASAVRKFIDKNMWQKARELTQTTQDTQIKKQEADYEDKDRSADVQKFIGPSKAIVPSELVIKPFNTCCFPRQQDSKASNANKKHEEDEGSFKNTGDVNRWSDGVLTTWRRSKKR